MVMLRAQLISKGALVGSYEGPLFENRQAFELFSDVPAPQDPGWEEHLRLIVLVKTSEHSDWVQIYDDGTIDPERWLDDIAFVEKKLGEDDLENMRICPLMPLNTLSEGTMQLFFEATPKDDDDHERSLQNVEVGWAMLCTTCRYLHSHASPACAVAGDGALDWR